MVPVAQLRRVLAEEAALVVHVAHQHARGTVVAGDVHRLRQVDNDGAVLCQQDVELRQVAVQLSTIWHFAPVGIFGVDQLLDLIDAVKRPWRGHRLHAEFQGLE